MLAFCNQVLGQGNQVKTAPGIKPQAAPGWLVDVFPYDGRSLNTAQDYLVQIVVPPSGFSLLSHLKSFPANNPTFYRGKAILNIKQGGRYLFYLGSNTSYTCTGGLSIDGKKIIEEKPIQRGAVIFGGSDFEPGLFQIQFVMECYSGKADVNIQVRGPGESTPRDVRADEIFVRRD